MMSDNKGNSIGKISERRHKKVKFKTPKRYRLSFFNENTLNCDWSVRMSLRKMIVLIAVTLLTASLIGAVIIAFTPLKNILPGYLRPTDRKEYLAANDRIDSLLQVVAYNDMYINNVNAIMTGDLPTDSIFSTYSAETVIPENTDSLLAPSEAEAAFVEEYRLRNEFNLPEPTDPDVQNSHPQFAAPVRNAVVSPGRSSTSPSFSFSDERITVYAIGHGTITGMDRNDNGTFTVIIQHPDGYMSRYSGMTRLYRNRRQRVESGTRIGMIDRNASDKATQFSFELWQNGTQLPPTEYITF